MLAGDFSPAFALKHALKDAELAAQAAQASGAVLTLTSAMLPRWRGRCGQRARRRRPFRGLSHELTSAAERRAASSGSDVRDPIRAEVSWRQ